MKSHTDLGDLTIGKVARLSGVGIETVRFYERNGLIPPPGRSASGYRRYSEDTVARIRFVRRAKELGFTLKEIKELLSLRLQPDVGCGEIRGRAEAKIADIEEKIRTLESMKAALVTLTGTCRGEGPVSECPILDALDHE
ncbi:MAG: heavy metal-responsive transcriptional regulator [Thermodesulfobacteriota bacterium]